MTDNAKIIPVASGKGGMRKSLFTANIAIALARMGNPTIAIDLGLDASDLHIFLNIANEYPGVGNFLKTRGLILSDLQVPTSFPNLKIITDDGRSPHMANITYGEKLS
ncbi:P-loop NTPase [Thermodesulfobacteriota bacterium]